MGTEKIEAGQEWRNDVGCAVTVVGRLAGYRIGKPEKWAVRREDGLIALWYADDFDAAELIRNADWTPAESEVRLVPMFRAENGAVTIGRHGMAPIAGQPGDPFGADGLTCVGFTDDAYWLMGCDYSTSPVTRHQGRFTHYRFAIFSKVSGPEVE